MDNKHPTLLLLYYVRFTDDTTDLVSSMWLSPCLVHLVPEVETRRQHSFSTPPPSPEGRYTVRWVDNSTTTDDVRVRLSSPPVRCPLWVSPLSFHSGLTRNSWTDYPTPPPWRSGWRTLNKRRNRPTESVPEPVPGRLPLRIPSGEVDWRKGHPTCRCLRILRELHFRVNECRQGDTWPVVTGRVCYCDEFTFGK